MFVAKLTDAVEPAPYDDSLPKIPIAVAMIREGNRVYAMPYDAATGRGLDGVSECSLHTGVNEAVHATMTIFVNVECFHNFTGLGRA